jgi:hypothetical protein
MIGAGSLDGFAIGALMTGACALAVTAPRRTRERKAPSAPDGALAAEEGGWLCEHVLAAETAWEEVAAEAAVAGSFPTLAAPSETVAPELVAAAMVPGLVAEAVASAVGAEAFEASAERLASYEEFAARRRGAAKIASGYRSRHRLGDPASGSTHWDGVELVFADPQPSDQALGSPKRTEARCIPRHAAPSAGLGGRLTGFGNRLTGLFAGRALASGARG